MYLLSIKNTHFWIKKKFETLELLELKIVYNSLMDTGWKKSKKVYTQNFQKVSDYYISCFF